jgi:pimeloyl-ACP methyl ester carboxylesterase
VVLVHGLSGSLEEWRTVQERLAREVSVLAYDRGGMGFSDAMTPNDAEAQAEELAEVLRATGLEPPYVVVTYSASALLASLFALRYPEQVQALLFLDSILPDWGYLAPRFFVAHLVQSFFGVLRLKAPSEFGGAPATLDEKKEQAVYARYAHWIASTDDGVRLGNWESRLLGLPPFAGFPVGVLTTFDERRDYEKGCVDKSRLLAARAGGTFASVREEHGPMSHHDLLTTAKGADVVAAFVRRISQG